MPPRVSTANPTVARPALVASVAAVRATAATPRQAQLEVYSDTLTTERNGRTSPVQFPSTSPQPTPIDDDGQKVDGFDRGPASAWIEPWLKTPTKTQAAHAILPKHRPTHLKTGEP